MSERILDGKVAYGLALSDLKLLHRTPHLARTVYRDKFFRDGEDGYGLIIIPGLAYVTSECAEELRAFEGALETGENWPRNVQWRSIGGKIPENMIEDVLLFTSSVKYTCKINWALRNSSLFKYKLIL